MAYIHCHNCDYSQDDFWSWRYNPIRRLLGEIRWLWIPRMIVIEYRVFSWVWLARCLRWRLTAPFRQRWWTYASWKRAIAKNGGRWPACPKCKQHRLRID